MVRTVRGLLRRMSVGRTVTWMTLGVALIVFCVVQDRVTAEGARRYVALQRASLQGGGPSVTVDEVMQPAIARSVQLGLLSSGAVIAAGAGIGLLLRRRWPNA